MLADERIFDAGDGGAVIGGTMQLLYLRTWEFKDLGCNSLIRCRHCAAGWMPCGNYHPGAMIEHSLKHQRKPTRIQLLAFQLEAIGRALAEIDHELEVVPAPAIAVERRHFVIWRRAIESDLATACATQPIGLPRRRTGLADNEDFHSSSS